MSVKKEASGRRSVQVEVEVPGTPEEVWQAIATGPGISSWLVPAEFEERVGALQAIATAAGHKVTHVKAHGAISNVACEDDMTAQAIANGIKSVDPSLIFVVLANSRLVKAGEAANLPMVHEVFADRAYEDDGSLVSRRKPGAVLHDPR